MTKPLKHGLYWVKWAEDAAWDVGALAGGEVHGYSWYGWGTEERQDPPAVVGPMLREPGVSTRMAVTERELMIHLGYEIYEHRSHVGPLWGWRSPFGTHNSHLQSRELAWRNAEQIFTRELVVAEKLIELLKGRV